ncbi:MAG: hypothetical protein J4432_01705 [DPANN group archaeon]|nr:hypothetical protein [DPANN group archaeon]
MAEKSKGVSKGVNKFGVLVALFVLVLTLGPMSYFFTGSSQLDIGSNELEATEPVSNIKTFTNAEISADILDIKPFINFIGESSTNDQAQVVGIIDSLGYSNHSVRLSLGQRSGTYAYNINLPQQPNTTLTESGFRLAYNLLGFFNKSSGYPISDGSVKLLQNITIGNETIVTKAETLPVTLLYSKINGTRITIVCPVVVTDNRSILQNIQGKCIDKSLTEPQQYLGLQLGDVIFIQPISKKLDIDVLNFTQFKFSGTYPGGIEIKPVSEIRGDLLQLIQRHPEIEIMEPDNRVTIPGANASTLNFTEARAAQAGNDTVVSFSNKSLAVEEIEQQLSGTEYYFENGTFEITIGAVNDTGLALYEEYLLNNSFNVEAREKLYAHKLPGVLEVAGVNYTLTERFRIFTFSFDFSEGTGEKQVALSVFTKYKEIVGFEQIPVSEVDELNNADAAAAEGEFQGESQASIIPEGAVPLVIGSQ